jgi:hypothetical protein
MDNAPLSVIGQLLANIDGALPDNRPSQLELARHAIQHLDHSGGQIEPIGDGGFQRTQLTQLGNWAYDPWEDKPVYGVDSSTTRPLEYANGLIVDIAHAKIGTGGAGHPPTIEGASSVSAAVYLDNPDATLHDMSLTEEDVTADLLHLPSTTETPQGVTTTVSSIAQRHAEGMHINRHLDALNGPLFIDGSVYPLYILYYLLLADSGFRPEATVWDGSRDIVRAYVEVIDTMADRGLPVVGIVKESSTTEVVQSLRVKTNQHNLEGPDGNALRIPWQQDAQLFAQVLQDTNEDYLKYLPHTDWFVSRGREVDGNHFELLSPIADELLHGDPEVYRRGFFYCRLPRTGDILRIEAPLLMIQSPDMRRVVKLKTLKEIALRRGIPQPIQRADRLARITRDNRDTIEQLIDSAAPMFDHNNDGRWRDLVAREVS